VRQLIRESGVQQHAVERYLAGKRVHPSTRERIFQELSNKPIPGKLWHYTSVEGFQKIVTSKRIYATDLRFLNDREEFVHSKIIASQLIENAPELGDDGFPHKKHLADAYDLAAQRSAGNRPVSW
jgi:hypothetical protein